MVGAPCPSAGVELAFRPAGGDYSARKSEIDWITNDPEVDFVGLAAQFDTMVMGRKTYELARAHGASVHMPGISPYVSRALWSSGIARTRPLLRHRLYSGTGRMWLQYEVARDVPNIRRG